MENSQPANSQFSTNKEKKAKSIPNSLLVAGFIMIVLVLVGIISFVGYKEYLKRDKGSINFALSQIADALNHRDSEVFLKYVDQESFTTSVVDGVYSKLVEETVQATGLDKANVEMLLTKDMVRIMVERKGATLDEIQSFIDNDSSKSNQYINEVTGQISKYKDKSFSKEKTVKVPLEMDTPKGKLDISLEFSLVNGTYLLTGLEVSEGWDTMLKILQLN